MTKLTTTDHRPTETKMSHFEPYNHYHQRAAEDGKIFGKKHAEWMYNLLQRTLEYWKATGTELPDIDLFDETVRAVEFEKETKACTSARTASRRS